MDKGRAETERMFALIGQAITRWSFVEERLCAVFMICTSDVVSDPRGALDFGECSVPMAVFYSVENFRGKLGLVNAALLAHASGTGDSIVELRADWVRLHEKIRKLSLKRNKLAHYTVLPGYDYKNETMSPRLVPPYGSPAYFRETGPRPGKKTLHLLHLQHMEQAFFLLEEKIRAFASRLARQEDLFDRYARRLARRIVSHSHDDPTRAERLKLALSSLK